MKWVTRDRPKIDRVACPWLIQRFIEKQETGEIEVGLQVAERQLSHEQGFLLGSEVTLADYYLTPSTRSFGRTPEGKTMYASFPLVQAWRERMEALPTVRSFRAAQPPRISIPHARK